MDNLSFQFDGIWNPQGRNLWMCSRERFQRGVTEVGRRTLNKSGIISWAGVPV